MLVNQVKCIEESNNTNKNTKKLIVIRFFGASLFVMRNYTIFTTCYFSLIFQPFLRSLFGGLPGFFLAIGGNTTSSKSYDGTFPVLSQGKDLIGITYVS